MGMGPTELETLAQFADIIGAGSIVTGLTVGWFHIRHLRRQQRDAIAVNLAQTFYNAELATAMQVLQPLPDGITLEEMRALGPEVERAAITLSTSFETMGLLVYKGIAPLDLVLDLAGGIVSTMCRKLRRWLEDIRVEQRQPSWGEWFEWLGDQAISRKTEQLPAHIEHAGWKPRRGTGD
jgi:hypothetical protein